MQSAEDAEESLAAAVEESEALPAGPCERAAAALVAASGLSAHAETLDLEARAAALDRALGLAGAATGLSARVSLPTTGVAALDWVGFVLVASLLEGALLAGAAALAGPVEAVGFLPAVFGTVALLGPLPVVALLFVAGRRGAVVHLPSNPLSARDSRDAVLALGAVAVALGAAGFTVGPAWAFFLSPLVAVGVLLGYVPRWLAARCADESVTPHAVQWATVAVALGAALLLSGALAWWVG